MAADKTKEKNIEKAYEKLAGNLFDEYSLLFTKVKLGNGKKEDITKDHFKDYLKAFKITDKDGFIASLDNDITKIPQIVVLTQEKKASEPQIKVPIQVQLAPVDTIKTIVPRKMPQPSLPSEKVPELKVPAAAPEPKALQRQGNIDIPKEEQKVSPEIQTLKAERARLMAILKGKEPKEILDLVNKFLDAQEKGEPAAKLEAEANRRIKPANRDLLKQLSDNSLNVYRVSHGLPMGIGKESAPEPKQEKGAERKAPESESPKEAKEKKKTEDKALVAGLKDVVPGYKGGKGSLDDPYVLDLRDLSNAKSGLGAMKITYPFVFAGSFKTNAIITLDQLSDKNIEMTCKKILKDTSTLVKRLSSSVLTSAITQPMIDSLKASRDKTFKKKGLTEELKYLRTH